MPADKPRPTLADYVTIALSPLAKDAYVELMPASPIR
jgi:hypothetical protein